MTRGWRARHRGGDAIRVVLLGGAVIIALLPLLWTALAAIGIEPHNETSPPSWVGTPTLDHLAEVSVVEPAFWQELATSVGVSVAAAILASAVSFLAAYGIARSAGSLPRRVNPAMLVLATLPVMAYVLPLRDVLRRLGLFDTLPGITFAYDPWAAGVEACCYVLEAAVVDRVINSNTVYGAHQVSSVHSITIA